VVTGGVTCQADVTTVSHVTAAAGMVLLAPGTTASAVTFGTTPPDCPSF
jgi:hypothetical protein